MRSTASSFSAPPAATSPAAEAPVIFSAAGAEQSIGFLWGPGGDADPFPGSVYDKAPGQMARGFAVHP